MELGSSPGKVPAGGGPPEKWWGGGLKCPVTREWSSAVERFLADVAWDSRRLEGFENSQQGLLGLAPVRVVFL